MFLVPRKHFRSILWVFFEYNTRQSIILAVLVTSEYYTYRVFDSHGSIPTSCSRLNHLILPLEIERRIGRTCACPSWLAAHPQTLDNSQTAARPAYTPTNHSDSELRRSLGSDAEVVKELNLISQRRSGGGSQERSESEWIATSSRSNHDLQSGAPRLLPYFYNLIRIQRCFYFFESLALQQANK